MFGASSLLSSSGASRPPVRPKRSLPPSSAPPSAVALLNARAQAGAVAHVGGLPGQSTTLRQSSRPKVASLQALLELPAFQLPAAPALARLTSNVCPPPIRRVRPRLQLRRMPPEDAALVDLIVEKELDADGASDSDSVLNDVACCVEDNAVHPLRAAAPTRMPYRRGSRTNLDDSGEDRAAVVGLRSRKLALSSVASQASLRGWWVQRARARGLHAFPLTPRKIELAAALLRKGGYRSALNYLSAARKQHVRKGHKWTDQLQLMWMDCKRALLRGRGPDKQAQCLPLDVLAELPADLLEAASKPYWPAAGLSAAVVACAWLTREIESSSTYLDSTWISERKDDEGPCGVGYWDLPASKADFKALGKVRCLACSCPCTLCPVKALRRVRGKAEDMKLQTGRQSDGTWPLIPRADGAPMNKKDVAAFYKDLASLAGFSVLFVPPHAARVTGAARMALAGHSEGVIQIFGRWGSSVVLRYVREALLGSCGGRVATPQAACSLSLAELRSIAAKKLPAGMGRQRSHALSAAWAEQAVEQVVNSVPAQPIEWEDFKRQFDARLDELAHDVDALRGRSLPLAVQCLGGKRHRVLDATRCYCSWRWSSQGGVPLPPAGIVPELGSSEALRLWCSKCLSH